MKPSDFVTNYWPFAKETEQATGISAIAILAQAALESGWGDKAPGNMFFGVKDPDKGTTGKGQLIVTTEYFKTPNNRHLFPEVIKIEWSPKRNRWRYIVKDWFRKFDSPADSFTQHTLLLTTNPRYAKAVANGQDTTAFFKALQTAGYATAPNYAEVLIAVCNTVKRNIPDGFESTVTKKSGEAPVEFSDFDEEELWDYLPVSAQSNY